MILWDLFIEQIPYASSTTPETVLGTEVEQVFLRRTWGRDIPGRENGGNSAAKGRESWVCLGNGVAYRMWGVAEDKTRDGMF